MRVGTGRFGFSQGQRGFSLVEALLAVAIMAAIGVAFIAALDTNVKATGTLDEKVTAVNLATAHFEAIRELPYDNTYPEYSSAADNITIPPQYSVVIDCDYSSDGTTWSDTYSSSDQTLQRITISVSREGGEPVFSTCTYRAER